MKSNHLLAFGLHEAGWDALFSLIRRTCDQYRDIAADCDPAEYPMARGAYRAATTVQRLLLQFRQDCLREPEDA